LPYFEQYLLKFLNQLNKNKLHNDTMIQHMAKREREREKLGQNSHPIFPLLFFRELKK
jgi:hypothetical protein